MKKRKLRGWVKVVLYILGTILLIKLLQWDAVQTEKAINTCLERGYSMAQCEDIKG